MAPVVPFFSAIGAGLAAAAPAIGAVATVVGTGLAVSSATAQRKQAKKQASLLAAQQAQQVQQIEQTIPGVPPTQPQAAQVEQTAQAKQVAQAGQEVRRRAIRRRVPTILTSGQGLAPLSGGRTILGG